MPPATGAHIALRDMTREDVRTVRRIESAAYQDAWPARVFETELENGFAQYRVAVEQPALEGDAGPASSAPLAALRRALGRGPREHIVGFMGVWYMVDQLHLVTVAVAPERQGEGIGRRLLLDCFDLALEADLNEIVLEARVSNERARGLYESFGFRQAGVLVDYYKDNHEDAVVMLSGPLDTDVARARLDALRSGLATTHPGVFAD